MPTDPAAAASFVVAVHTHTPHIKLFAFSLIRITKGKRVSNNRLSFLLILAVNSI